MKTAAALAPILLLVACAQHDTPAQDAVKASASEAVADISGVYRIALADGTVMIETIVPDGTYVDTTQDGAETERGR